jgi:hypothetical protein
MHSSTSTSNETIQKSASQKFNTAQTKLDAGLAKPNTRTYPTNIQTSKISTNIPMLHHQQKPPTEHD